MKKKCYDDGGEVDFDKDSDSESQKVYNSKGEELSDAERRPRASSATPSAKSKAKRDDGSYDRKEQRRGMMSGFGEPSKKKATFGETMRKRAKDVMGFKKGGSIDGCAQRGKTKGRMI